MSVVNIVNEMQMPCEGCKFEERCFKQGTECFAFRRWAGTGQYAQKQIGHLRRRA